LNDDELIAQLIATAQPRTSEVRVCARGDLVDRHAALVAQLAEAERNVEKTASIAGDPEVARIAGEIVAVEAEQEASTVTFKLANVTRREWADLLAAHPPRPEDKGLDHNADTFPPAAVAACSKSPKITEERAAELLDKLPPAESSKLWLAAVGLNVTGTPHPKLRAATELVQANVGSSTTPEGTGSPDPSSSAGSGARSRGTTTGTKAASSGQRRSRSQSGSGTTSTPR
jgi:hypothetical protein